MALLTLSTTSASTPDVLEDIRNKECNLAIWKRTRPLPAEALLGDAVQDVRFEGSRHTLRDLLPKQLSASEFQPSSVRDILIDDICRLSELYCEALRIEEIDVRLEVVTTNSCRKWHADYVSARLITTYVGTGTQWIDDDEAERVSRGEEPISFNQMAEGEVGLFKGKLATEKPSIHRSPPIEGTGETRLLLVLNPASKQS